MASSPHRVFDSPGRSGVWLAGLAAAAAALPGLRLPFLSDDWANLVAIAERAPLLTPFGFFRPLYLASLRMDLLLWGLSPLAFHLTNFALLGGIAALVVLLGRRYAGDATAALAGVLFAFHPHHVECAAWVAARGDLLSACLFLAAVLSYDRWRSQLQGVPVLALICFAGALLAKETAIMLPVLLLLVGVAVPSRRPTAREWVRGYIPMIVMAAAYVAWMRRIASDAAWERVAGGIGISWLKKLLYFGTAAVVPVQVEALEGSPASWGALALVTGTGLLAIARARSGRIPRAVWIAAAAFVILLGPALFEFQERYLFLPSAAAAIAIASLILAAGPRPRVVAGVLLVSLWLVATVWHWKAWSDAATVSRRLIEDLVQASRRPGVGEIVVANMPHRVHGVPVAGNFRAAVTLSGGRSVIVRPVLYVDYPAPSSESLDGQAQQAVRRESSFAEVALRIPARLFSRSVVFPTPKGAAPEPGRPLVFDEHPDRTRVRIPRVAGRAAFVWTEGRLEGLF